MKVFGENVLIKEVLEKKTKNVVLLDDVNADREEFYEITHREILGFGEGYKGEAKIGDDPIISTYANPIFMKVTKGKANDNIIERLIVHKGEYIIGKYEKENQKI